MSEAELLQEAFYNFDHDRDGYLTLDELRFIVTSDGEKMTAQDVEELIQEAANFADSNGYIDYKVFAQVMSDEDA